MSPATSLDAPSARLLALLERLLWLLPLTSFFVVEGFYRPFYTLKALALRVLLEVAAVVWLVLALREPRARPPGNALVAAVLLFYLSAILSTIFSTSPERSFYGNALRMEGLTGLLHWLVFFLVLAGVRRLDPDFLRRFLGVVFAASLLITLFGIFHYFELLRFLPYVLTWGAGFGRAASFIAPPAAFGSYGLFIAGLALFSYFQFGARGRAARIFYLIAMLSGLLAVALSGTRSAAVSAEAGLTATLAFVALKRPGRPRRLSVAAILLLVILAGAFWQLRTQPAFARLPVLGRFADVYRSGDSSTVRLAVWRGFLTSWRERPVLGWGVEQSLAAFTPHIPPEQFFVASEPWHDRPHNKFVELLVIQGALGLATYLFVLLAAARMLLVRPLATPPAAQLYANALLLGFLAAYCANQFFLFDFQESYLLFFTFLVFMLPSAEPASADAPERLSAKKLGLVVLAAAVAVWALAGNVQNFRALRRIHRAVYTHTPEAARGDLRAAFELTGSFREEAAQEMVFYAKRIRDPAAKKEATEEADRYMDRAIATNPLNMKNYVLAVENLLDLCAAKRALGERNLAAVARKLNAYIETIHTSAPSLPFLTRADLPGPRPEVVEACR